MTKHLRTIVSLTALALIGVVPVGAAWAAQTNIPAKVNVVKSLTLTKKQDLDFGTVTLSGAAGTYTVSISQAGILRCPAGASCVGAAVPGIMNVQGSNQQLVRITVAPGNLVNSADGSTIPLTPDAPATVQLTNSGFPGKDFNIGGSIDIPSTADGTYAGNIVVTVDYQ